MAAARRGAGAHAPHHSLTCSRAAKSWGYQRTNLDLGISKCRSDADQTRGKVKRRVLCRSLWRVWGEFALVMFLVAFRLPSDPMLIHDHAKSEPHAAVRIAS